MGKLTKAQRAKIAQLRAKAREHVEDGLWHAREAQSLEREANRLEAAIAQQGE